jgi:transcriptional regulator with XRE-family HTH domain
MAIDFVELGERLRAYRIGTGLSPEEAARRLQISRAALYNYEKGGAIKIETIQRFAGLLGVSVPSLLGVGVEYFSNAVSYFERKRQLEEKSEQIVTYFEPISVLLASPEYTRHLRQMLEEGLPRAGADRAVAIEQIDQMIELLEARRATAGKRHTHIVNIVSAVEIAHFLRSGLIGSYGLTPQVQEERRRLARAEVERLAAMMDDEPIGVQIGVVEDTLPNQTFEIFHLREKAVVAVSPYRLGEFPNVHLGIASITAAEEAVALYGDLAQKLWGRACKGVRGAELLRRLIKDISPTSSPRRSAKAIS